MIGWLFMWLFIHVGSSCLQVHAESMDDAEFVIEKYKKNKVDQQKKHFFHAPLPSKRQHDAWSPAPLPPSPPLHPSHLNFTPAPSLHDFSKWEGHHPLPPYGHYARLGFASFARLPYISSSIASFPLLKGIWSMAADFRPEAMYEPFRAASGMLQAAYKQGAWLLEPHVSYQYHHHIPPPLTASLLQAEGIHYLSGHLLMQCPQGGQLQVGSMTYHQLAYHRKKQKEQCFNLSYKWHKSLDPYAIKVTTHYDWGHYTMPGQDKTRWMATIQPCVYGSMQGIQYKLGSRFAYHPSPASKHKQSGFHFYPFIQCQKAMQAWLNPYLRASGLGVGTSIKPVHLRDYVAKHPWLTIQDEQSGLEHAHRYLQLALGSRGSMTEQATYHMEMAYRRGQNRCVMQYDDHLAPPSIYSNDGHSPCNILQWRLFMHYHWQPWHFQAETQARYSHHFAHANQDPCGHDQPSFTWHTLVRYHALKRCALTGQCSFVSAMSRPSQTDSSTLNLPYALDVRVGMDYFLTQHLSVFLLISNLLNRARSVYQFVPYQKRNIAVGLQYKW